MYYPVMASPSPCDPPESGVPCPREEEPGLAARAAAGDRAAQRTVVALLLPRVRKVTAATVRDPARAEDLSQTAMLRILESLKDFRGESSLLYWASRVALHMAIRALKTERRREQLLFFLPPPRSRFADTDAKAEAESLRAGLHRQLARLPEKQLSVIELRYLHDHSVRDIAQILQVPENTVRDRLVEGKRRLRTMMEKQPELREWLSQVTS
jgi:RNA polymerase sigma-70 factor (ECF subfamily)